jgi:hypothetical protein
MEATWYATDNCIYGDEDGEILIAKTYGPMADTCAARIVACANACAGINPAAVPELVDVCRKVVADLPTICRLLPTSQELDMAIALQAAAYTALVKAQELTHEPK